ncbi:MAG: hypothetical protein DRQ78_08695 [Epsilonproteobacteria bacterium]|nr:MAG: hypothetical protein DRQ78_08695 [Campylobacterota bacterium]
MLSLDSNKVRNFLDYMLFFEYAKHLKDSSVIKRGLLSPDIEDESNIRKRISSVLLKGLRCDLGFDIGAVVENEKEYAVCNKITRVRSRSNHTTENYFSFTNLYSAKRFISGDMFDINSVHTITGAAHKEGLMKAMALGGDEDKIQAMLDKYEIVFFKTPSWWSVKQNISDQLNTIPGRINNVVMQDCADGDCDLNPIAGNHIPIRNISVEISQSNTSHRYGMYYFRDVAGDTVSALFEKYCQGKSTRIPSPNYEANSSYPTNPVLNNGSMDRLLSEEKNHVLFGIGNMISNMGDYSLVLCRKFEDDNGIYLAPNLFDLDVAIQWRSSKELLSKPEFLFKYVKEFDRRIKNCLIGRDNE